MGTPDVVSAVSLTGVAILVDAKGAVSASASVLGASNLVGAAGLPGDPVVNAAIHYPFRENYAMIPEIIT